MASSESKSIQIERTESRLTISVRTRRDGDVAHFVFGALSVLFASVVLWIALKNGTLLDSWVTLPLIVAGYGYGWFALTRITNRRKLQVDPTEVAVRTGPLPSLARGFRGPVDAVKNVRIRKEKRWVPPIWFFPVHHVESDGVAPIIFKGITSEADADRIKAAIVAQLSRQRGVGSPLRTSQGGESSPA
jgi:hypothetical protein